MNSLKLTALCASVLTYGDAFTATHPTILSSVSSPPSSRSRKSIRLDVLVDPVDAADHVSFALRDHGEMLANHAGGSFLPSVLTNVLSTSFLGIGEKATGVVSAQDMLDYASKLDSSSSAAAAALSPSEPIRLFDGSGREILAPTVPIAPTMTAEAEEYIARSDMFMSKIPLAAITFVFFDFFFVSSQRAFESESVYDYDEDAYLEGTQGDTPEEIAIFSGGFAIRIALSLLIVYLTAVVSDATYHPHF